MILDEAQHIKNPLSATARAAKKLKSERRLALTGTPIENRLSEIWSIFDFVSPGLLGDLKTFEETLARPIDRGDEETAEKLRATIHPFVMRRTKAEVAPELPGEDRAGDRRPARRRAAEALQADPASRSARACMSEVEKQGIAKAQIQILAALTRLRQVACDPRLMKLEGEWDDDESGKLNALREIVQEAVAGGHRVLVFSQFVEMLKLIREVLDEDKIKYEYLDGSTKDRHRARRPVQRRTRRYDAFLISLKAGGTGLNLTGADTVIHFDPWWNPAVEDQATDRAHRIGQTKVVTVYRLIARGHGRGEDPPALREEARARLERPLERRAARSRGSPRATSTISSATEWALLDARGAAELEALVRALVELAARGPADRVDRARVLVLGRPEVHARSVRARRERDQSEVAGLDRAGDVLAAERSPSHEVGLGDQDAAVVAAPAARAACETVERGRIDLDRATAHGDASSQMNGLSTLQA